MEKSRAIFDAAVDSIIVIDENLKIIEASPSSDSTFAFTREQTEGRMALDFVHPEDRGLILEALERGFVERRSDEGPVPGPAHRRSLGDDRVAGPDAS